MPKRRMAVLKALMSNPKSSDRNISKVVGVSQPTITRIRRSLVEKGIIESYEIIPNLQKLGFEILAFATVEPTKEVEADERVIYAIDGIQTIHAIEGIRTMFTISVHKDYYSWAGFAGKYGAKWSFLIPTSYKPMVPLSFKNIPL